MMLLKIKDLLYVLIFIIEQTTQEELSPPLIKQNNIEEIWFESGENSYILPCEATGQPTPRFSWLKDGVPLMSIANNQIVQKKQSGTLIISEPEDSDAGVYQCFAANQFGLSKLKPIHFRKAYIGKFTFKNSVNVTAEEGRPFKIPCNPPTGKPEREIFWNIQNKNNEYKLISNPRLTVDPNGTLWFSNITITDDSGISNYICSVKSKYTKKIEYGNKIFITVHNSTKINTPPTQQYVSSKTQTAFRGQIFKLFCIFGGTPLPKISWHKNGKSLPDISNKYEYGNYNKTLSIKNVLFTDGGLYSCNASNIMGNKFHTVKLTILAKPYFVVKPESQIITKGTAYEFRCEAYGHPDLIKNDFSHNGIRFEQAGKTSNIMILKDRLIVSPVLPKDTGVYGCNASSPLGYVYTEAYVIFNSTKFEATNNAQCKNQPIKHNTTKLYEVIVNSTTVLPCNVSYLAVPDLHIYWTKNSKLLDHLKKYELLSNNSLKILNTTYSDSGNYTCVVKTPLNTVNNSVTLLVLNVPRSPIFKNLFCGSTSAKMTWKSNEDDELPILYYYIEYKTNFLPEWQKVNASLRTSYTFRMNPWTNYTFRLIAANKMGESEPSGRGACKSAPNVPFNNPDIIEITGSGRNGLNVTWDPMLRSEYNGPNFHYVITWKETHIKDSKEIYAELYNLLENVYIIRNLTRLQKYTVKVFAVNDLGRALAPPKEIEGIAGLTPNLQSKNYKLFLIYIIPPAFAIVLVVIPCVCKKIRKHFNCLSRARRHLELQQIRLEELNSNVPKAYAKRPHEVLDIINLEGNRNIPEMTEISSGATTFQQLEYSSPVRLSVPDNMWTMDL